MLENLPDLKTAGNVIKNAPSWLDNILGTLDKYNLLPMWKWRQKSARDKASLEQELKDDEAAHERRREALRSRSLAEAEGIAKVTAAEYDAIAAKIQNNINNGMNPISAFMCDSLAVRAMHRWLETTIEEQYAQERIAKWACFTALEQPDAQIGQGQTSEAFFAHFWDMARGIRDEDALRFWGRLLAGEILHTGSFSLRTLDVLRKLKPEESQLLKQYSKYAFNGLVFVELNTFTTPESLQQEWSSLYESGLVEAEFTSGSFTLESGQTVNYQTWDRCYYIKNTGTAPILFSGGMLTEAGRELIAVNSGAPDFVAILDTLPKEISRSSIKYGEQLKNK